ncbi:MAG: ABC transporter permease [Lachnospiraceae bacterium]|nr:ABC transporter permease [Lachnospiraceae bacterium]
MSKKIDYTNIPKEKFQFCQQDASIHDKKFDTKPVGYFKDAMMRFCRNKSSVAAACIICFLLLFAFLVPAFCSNTYSEALTDTTYLQYGKLLPKCEAFAWAGWDGGKDETLTMDQYNYYRAIGVETGKSPIMEVYRENYEDPSSTTKSTYYDVRTDSYTKNGMVYLTMTPSEYQAVQEWQLETGIQVIYPAVDTSDIKIASLKSDANIWYKCTNKGMPKLDKNGNYVPMYKTTGNDGDYNSLRVEGDDGSYRYAVVTGSSTAMSFKVRVFLYNYFQFRYGFEPSFLFGTNNYGQDIITRLASGARFSFLLAISVSAINLFIGAIYGAIEGYYGGVIDLTMERISDILSGIPFIVVTSLFQLHLSRKVGVVPALLFAFVLTGWIGMASRVRMQFYRFKNQEYILAARTLGASDFRLMFKHIFPNAIGTIITGSVLVIPSVVYSESNLTYLGIVNLDSSTMTSVGSMLSAGQPLLTTYPHVILFPALFISLMMISFNLFGNGLRDAFNPSLRGTED